MAVPKPGDKDYKGPVHEAVRGILNAVGIDTTKKPTKSPPPPRVKPQTLADRKQIAKGNKAVATAGNRNKGTYDTYDPLSSLAANTKLSMSRSKKTKKTTKKAK